MHILACPSGSMVRQWGWKLPGCSKPTHLGEPTSSFGLNGLNDKSVGLTEGVVAHRELVTDGSVQMPFGQDIQYISLPEKWVSIVTCASNTACNWLGIRIQSIHSRLNTTQPREKWRASVFFLVLSWKGFRHENVSRRILEQRLRHNYLGAFREALRTSSQLGGRGTHSRNWDVAALGV